MAGRRLSGAGDRGLHCGLRADKPRADWFRKLKAHANPDIGHGIRYQDTPWHKFEIQHLRFRRYLGRLLKKFGPSAGETPEQRTMGEDPAEADTKVKLAS